MTDAAAGEWRCSVCLVQNRDGVARCVACETPREPAVYDGPPILFGGGDAAPVDISQPPTLISRTSTLICNTPQATATAPMAFCKAMTTPISRSEPVFLSGCDTADLIDKTDCIGILKIHPGRLKTWGSGECDQLPIKSDLADEYHGVLRPLPIRAFSDRSVTQICCGSLTSYALRENNEVWSWGCPDNGPLGRPIKNADNDAWNDIMPPDGSVQVTSGKVPERVWGLPSDDRVLKIVAGDSHAGVLTESGDVYIWGHYRDFTGPLGFWDGEEIVETRWVPLKLTLPGVALDIASGENHTVILVQCSSSRDKRCLVVMGSNEFGQLCTIPSLPTLPPEVEGAASLSPDQSRSILTPIDLSPEDYLDVRHQYLKPHVIPLEKLVFCVWKRKANIDGKTINEFEEMFKTEGGDTSPRREDLKITKVCAGSATTFLKIVDAGESLWFACGRGTYGELGGGFTEQALYNPTLISMPLLCAFETIVGGDFTTFALSSDGSVWAWGKGELCGLGSNVDNKVLVPKAIPGLRNKCHTVSCGMKTTYSLTHAGFVFVWGEGNNYQLGLGANDDVVTLPTRIPPDHFENEAVVDIVAGANHVVCLINEVIERRGAKRTRMLDEADEMPSVIKKSRTEMGCLSERIEDSAQEMPQEIGLEKMTSEAAPASSPTPLSQTLIDRPSLMFLPTAPLSPKMSPTREISEPLPAVNLTPRFPQPEPLPNNQDVIMRSQTDQSDHPLSMPPNFGDRPQSPGVADSNVDEMIGATQRPTLMPQNGAEPEIATAAEPEDAAEESDGEELVAEPMSESHQESDEESSEVEHENAANENSSDLPSAVEVDISATEIGESVEEVAAPVAPPGTTASSRKQSPKSKRTTPAQKRPNSAIANQTPTSKPRDSLTAVLISADRPYDDTPKPSQGELEPERELEKAVAEHSENDEAEDSRETIEEPPASTATKAKVKARAKPKAKTKAKPKAKGRPGRKPKVAVEEEASQQAEESVAEETAPPSKRAPVRRTRVPRSRTKDEDSLSSVVDSGDEEVEGGGSVKKTATTARGRAKAKGKVVNKKK